MCISLLKWLVIHTLHIIYSVILCHVKLPVYIWKYMEYYKSSVVLLLCRTPKTTTYEKFSRSGMFDRKYSPGTNVWHQTSLILPTHQNSVGEWHLHCDIVLNRYRWCSRVGSAIYWVFVYFFLGFKDFQLVNYTAWCHNYFVVGSSVKFDSPHLNFIPNSMRVGERVRRCILLYPTITTVSILRPGFLVGEMV